MNAIIKYRSILYLCIPIFLILALYSQLQVIKVKDIHDALGSKLPVTEFTKDVSGIDTVVVIIPIIGPYLEVNSVTSMFKDMKSITDKYSNENSSKIFKDMQNEYEEEVGSNEDSIYLYNYNSTVQSMLSYFYNYSTLDHDSKVVKDSKATLMEDLKLLQMIAVFKIILYVMLFILALIGVFVFKGRYSEKDISV